MKKTLVIASLAVLSTSAFASKARMEALGQGTVSRYMLDTRSVFLNPAMVNEQKNYIITEWGTANYDADTDAAPRAEGGFFREMGTFTYGLYLGNNDSRIAHTGTFLDQTNGLDLFLGGDMGVKWGARVHYANAKDETNATNTATTKHNAFGLGLGAEMGDAEAYLNIDLADKSTGNGTVVGQGYESKMKPSYTVGGSYKFAGWSFFAEYDMAKLEEKTATTATTKDSTILVGAGRVHEINPTARLITDLSLSMNTNETAAGKVKTNALPATLGMEVDATSWLVLRGSVAQNIIYGETKNAAGKKQTTPNSTTVNAGATLNFGKLKVDGMIGNTGGARGTGAVGTKTGALTTDNLLTKVAVSYWF
jgi:hypothetical protein